MTIVARSHGARALGFFRAHLPVIALGVGGELLYALYFLRQFPLLRFYHQDIDMGGITGHSHAGFWAFVVVFSVLFLLFGLAWRWVARAEQRAFQPATLWLILGFGALFALTMTFVYPITAIDIFAYIDQSRILVHYHANPIFTPPSHYPSDPLMGLSAGWYGAPAPYGPLGIVIDALPTLLVGGNLLANLILLKLLFSALALGEAFMVYQILHRLSPNHALSGALLVAWNPLVIFEYSANGHNDIAMMFFVLLAALSLVENDLLFAVLLVVASALVKYATAILIPPFLLYGIVHQSTHRDRLQYTVITVLASSLLAALIYAPFWQGIDTITRGANLNQGPIESFVTLLGDRFPGSIAATHAAVLGRALFVPIYLYALWLATRRPLDLLGGSFLIMFFSLALVVTKFETWYSIWALALVAATSWLAARLAMVLMTYGTTIGAAFYGYIWVWLGVAKPGTFSTVDSAAYLVTFVPAIAVLLGFTVWHLAPKVRSAMVRSSEVA